MKKIISTFLALLTIVTLYAEENEIVTKSKIEKVTVFLSGAQVTRKARFTTKKGVNKIVFEGVSPRLNANSLQVKGKGDYVILDVAHNVFYPKPEPVTSTVPKEVTRDIRLLTDSIARYNDEVEEIRLKKSAYETEYNLMLNSGVYKGNANNDSIELLEKAMAFLRIKMNEINLEILQFKRKERKYQTEINRMNTRLSQLQNWTANNGLTTAPKPPIQRIEVTVSCKEPVSGSMRVSYQVYDASWTPSYDIRAENVSSPMMLNYKARVRQNSGEDWDNVRLTLSSANPNRSNTKPELAQWYIDFYKPIQYGRSSSGTVLNEVAISSSKKEKESRPRPSYDMAEEDIMLDATSASDFTVMSQSFTNVEFKIDLPYTIKSGNKEQLMAVTQNEIKPDYTHYVIPKIEKEAFLVAQVTDWEKLNLIPAVANIFFDGTYVGQTRLDPSVMSDTMNLSLGRDMGVVIKRKKTKDEVKDKPLTSDRVKTKSFEIEIRNNSIKTLNLVVQDQIPVTINEDIEITLNEKSGASHKEETGILEWRFKLRSKDTKRLKFGYSVKFDKDKRLANL